MSGFDARALRDACGSFATGVTVITTTTADDGDHGMTANAFMSMSLDPPLILISLNRTCRMLDRIRAAGRYAVNILAHDMEKVAWHFAGRHDESLNDILVSRNGLPVVPGAAAILQADVDQEIEAGDHLLFIGRVTHLERDAAVAPLLFHGGRFSRLTPASELASAVAA